MKTYIFAALIMALAMSRSTCAQDSSRGNVARIVFQQEIAPIVETEQSVENALDALKRETLRLRSWTKETTANDPLPRPEFPVQRPSLDPVLEDLRPKQSEAPAIEDIGDTRDIVERIELLKRIYEKKRVEKLNSAKAATLKAQSPVSEVQPQTTDVPQSDQSDAMNQPQVEHSTNPEPVPQSTPNLDRLFQDPVDLFEMGNSLYQAGDIRTALEAYVQVDKSQLTASDNVWLDFMTASCYRRLDDGATAVKLYRKIENQKEVPNLVKPAQRWIRQLEQLEKATSSLSKIDTEIESLLKTAQSYGEQ